jgi:predicted alpha-1,2-mannosidase
MFKKIHLVFLITLLIGIQISCTNTTKQDDFARYVNPFIGTAYNGHTFPGAALPFGMVQAGPETGRTEWKYCSGYNYADTVVCGFAQDHLNGTGCPDLGDILLLPFTGNIEGTNYSGTFSKKTEKAEPGYYTVALSNSGVDVEITVTKHTAFHKYTFHKGNAYILLDLQSGIVGDAKSLTNHVLEAEVNLENNNVISGHNHLKGWVTRHLYYTIEFDKPFTVSKTLSMAEGEKAQRYELAFNINPGEAVQVKVALSTTSIEGAKLNMKAENPVWNFDEMRRKAHEEWNTLLSGVQIEGTQDQKESFYTSLYHLYIQPNNIADVDGKYRGANDSVYVSGSKNYYSTLSLWDTYRAAHPLYTILIPDKVGDFVNTMLLHYDRQGALPIWTLWGKENFCMIANHSVPVIVDAYLKGFEGFDAERAYQDVKSTLTKNHLNSYWDIYMKYGYYPYDKIKVESVSRTLESAYDDYCAAQFAKALGHPDDYEYFLKRSKFYKNLFDPETKLMRGKDSTGGWRTPFKTLLLSHASTSGGDYTEGNAWQYTWHVQHDVAGLIDLMGGKEIFIARLDSLFEMKDKAEATGFESDVTGLIGQYAHGNEPSHHVAYLYSLAGKPWRTQELIHEINGKFYINKTDGLCGNDDCGQMSAWYIFSAMGFYPVDPISGQYVFGAPQLKRVAIDLPGGKTFTVEANNLSKDNIYVQSITLDTKPYDKLFITHKDIINGGLLIFNMGNQPKKN